MSGESTTSATDAGVSRSRLGTSLVAGSALFIVLMLLYLEKIPPALHWPMRLLFVAAVGWLLVSAFRALWGRKIQGKVVIFTLILAAMLYGALFVICAVFVKLMSAKDEALTTVDTSALSEKARRGTEGMLSGDSPIQYDREVGWVHRPGYAWKGHSISEQGLRGTRVYPETPADPDKRILTIGDSFTFGYEVPDDQTFAHHGEQLAPGTEWINLGICGGGLTQSLLQYRKNGRKFGGKYVVIGFMTNNIKRTVNCYRPFVSPDDSMTPLTKPYAKIVDGVFSLEPNPYQDVAEFEKLLGNESEAIGRLYEMDYFSWSQQKGATNPILRTLGYVWERRDGDRNLALLLNQPVDPHGSFRPGGDPYGNAIWHPKSLGFQANARVFDIYYNEIIADGRVPLIVILPSGADVEKRAEGGTPKHAALLDHFDAKGYRYFDFLDTLAEVHGDKLSPKDLYVKTHFNGETNALIAREIIKALSLE